MASTTFVPTQRLVAGSPGVLVWQPTDSEGEPAAPGGVVTVEVGRSNGNVVIAAGTATVAADDARTVTVPLAEMFRTDVLTATWSVDGEPAAVTSAEVVGGVYVSVAKIRELEPALADAATYPTPLIQAARLEVESMFEDVCRRAFVPRFRVDVVDGTGRFDLVVRRPDVREVRWATATDWRGTVTPLSVADVAGSSSGVLRRYGSLAWPAHERITIGYEFGLAVPPPDMTRAVVAAIRARLNQFRSGIPDRAVSFQQIDGGTVTLATPGTYGWVTGIPEVDEVIKRYRWKDAGVA
jgi:hypothetical protein